VLDSGDRVFALRSRSGFARDQAAREFQVRRLLHARSEGFEAVHWDIKRKKREGKGAGGEERKVKEGEYNSQSFQRGLNIRKFEKDGPVRDMLIVKHEADAPDNRREADVLGTGQVVQNNLRLGLGGHVVLRSNKDSIEEIKCNCIVSNRSTYEWKFSVETRAKD
jgi:hypothetical protein